MPQPTRRARTLPLSRAGSLYMLSGGKLFLGRGAQVYDTIHNWGGSANGDVDRYYFADGSALRIERSVSELWADSEEPVVRLVPELVQEARR